MEKYFMALTLFYRKNTTDQLFVIQMKGAVFFRQPLNNIILLKRIQRIIAWRITWWFRRHHHHRNLIIDSDSFTLGLCV